MRPATGEEGASSRAMAMLGALVAGVAVAAWTACFRAYGIFDFADEGAQLMQGLRAAVGERPYVDFATGYGPLYFAIQGRLVAAGGLPAVRLALTVVHGIATVALYVATRRLVGHFGAALTVLFGAAFFLPVAPRQGAPFMVPYPAWWVEAAALSSIVLMDRRRGLPSPARSGLAGALAGATFAMKPNSGLLLAAAGMAALVLGARSVDSPDGSAVSRRSVPSGPVGTALLLLVAFGALALVVPPGRTVLWWAVVPPVLVLAARGHRDGVPDADVAPRAAALAVGFFAVAVSSFAASFVRLGPALFLREALLVGTDVAEVYAVAFPAPALLAFVAGILAFAGHRRWSLAVASLALAATVVVAGDAATRAAAVRTAAEHVLATLVPIVLWGGLVVYRRERDAALVAPLAFAVTTALQLYPRPDFLHLASVGPVLLPLAVRLARDAARPRGVHAIRGVAIATVVVALTRLAPAMGTASAILRGQVERVRVGDVVLGVEPPAAPRLRALERAVDAVGARTDEAARVATFPGCALVPFLARRRGAGRHDYFFPGRPTREEGATLAAKWRASPPPVAVTCDAAGTDLALAWSAYPELAALFPDRYRPVVEAPPFVVYEARR